MRKFIYLIIAVFTFNAIALSQENSFPTESIYIHTNSETFISGESLLYKIYCFENSNNNLSKISKIAYVELFNSKGISLTRNKIELTDGIGNNEIFISTNYETGKYKFVGYTSWMQNNSSNKYFETEITIINPFKPFQNKEEKKSFNKFQKNSKNDSNHDLLLSLNKKTFSSREKITLQIENKELKSTSNNFSISVRKIDSLNFDNSNNVISQKSSEKISTISYLPELRGELLSGKITTENPSKKLENNDVALSFTGEKFDLKVFRTNSNGTFNFILDKNITNNNAFIQVLDDESNDYKIILDNPTTTKLIGTNTNDEIYINPNFVNQIEERLISCQIQNTYDTQDIFKNDKTFFPFYNPNQTDYILDDYKRFPSFKETIIEIIPSVYFKQNKEQYSLHIRDYVTSGDSYGKAMVLVDGLLIQNLNELFNYNTKNIYKISVINKPYVYGSRIFSGVISIITFDKNYSLIPKEVTPITIERYSTSTKYNQPNYNNTDLERIPDYRYQLLWKPNLEINNEKKSIEFYSSDIKGNFEITLEGFTDNGKHIVLKEYFSVE